ncbi:MAG: cobalamin biosynthesis protein [Oscillospiraceae bacterium]|nr:cobalamin biosynthesis protein [Oscillospiraceae bacterium]
MTLALLAFTGRGYDLACRLAGDLEGQAFRSGEPLGVREWTAQWFPKADALIYVGAAGIAVRAIAPFVTSKAEDPAVVVVDESGQYAIPILSGHLGGANDLARRIAALTGAECVVTTATDLNGCFAVDEWARHQGWAVAEPERIRRISARILAGESVTVSSDFPIDGDCPQGISIAPDGEIRVGIRRDGSAALHLIPPVAALGMGCKENTPEDVIESVFREFSEKHHLYPQAVEQVCSVTRKEHEPGLVAFCDHHGWPFRVFSPEELQALPGEFSASPFVLQVTGTDNVCERSAAAGSGGKVIIKKYADRGVTMALAVAERHYTWDWRQEIG